MHRSTSKAARSAAPDRPPVRPRRPRRPPPVAAAATAGQGNESGSSSCPSCLLSPLGRTFDFPHAGSGLLWARSTGLKLWPGAQLLARAACEADGAALAALHPRRAAGGAAAWGGWRDKAVLELGCGLGLVACAVAWMGAKVVATDGDADLLRVSHCSCRPWVAVDVYQGMTDSAKTVGRQVTDST
jgi:hypothetical protein